MKRYRRPSWIRLSEKFDAWVAGLESRSPNTARSYRYAVERFLERLAGGEFTNDTAATYLRSLSDLAPSSRAHHISAVRPRVAVTSYGHYLTLPEVQQPVDAAGELSPRHHAAVLTLAMTGLRVSELVNAEWRDLFQHPGRIGLRVLGKSDKERVIRVRDDLLAVISALHGSGELNAKDRSPLIPNTRGTAYSARGVHKLVAQATSSNSAVRPLGRNRPWR